MNNQSDPIQNNVAIRSSHLEKLVEILGEDFKTLKFQQITYLLLALEILKTWLEQYPIEIPYEFSEHNLTDDPNNGLITQFISDLQLGNLNACLFITNRLDQDFIEIPEVAVKSSRFASHLYLFIYIPEEEIISTNLNAFTEDSSEAVMLGFIRHDQLLQQQKGVQLVADEGYYAIPQISIDPSFNRLKTCTKFITPEKILSPQTTTVTDNLSLLDSIKTKIQKFATQPIISHRYIWQDLDLSTTELNVFFAHKELQESVKKILIDILQKNSAVAHSSPLIEHISTRSINLCSWFSGQLEKVTENLLQPVTPLEFVGEFYDADGFDGSNSGIISNTAKDFFRTLLGDNEIPETDAKVMPFHFSLEDIDCELLVGTWLESQEDGEQGWTILFVLRVCSLIGFPKNMTFELKNNFGNTHTEVMPEQEALFYFTIAPTFDEEIQVAILYGEASYSQTFFFEPIENKSEFYEIKADISTFFKAA